MSTLSLAKRNETIEFSCPSGGEWYACSSGSMFVGCCASDPCSNGCSQGNVRAGSFPEEVFGEFPDASCGSNSDFYTCTAADPPFWGCCKTNPCSPDGCPSGDLVPAFIDRPDQKAAYLDSEPSPSSSSSPGSSSTGESGGKSNTAAIAGGAAGGGVVILLLIGLAIFFIRRRRSRAGQQDNEQRYTAFPPSAQQPEKPDHGVYGQQPDSPPMYTSPAPAYASKFPGQENQHYDQYKSTHQQQFEAVELPSSPSQTTSQQRHLSELPSESALAPMELESPGPSSPAHSPRISATPEMNNNWGAPPQSPNRNSLQPSGKGDGGY